MRSPRMARTMRDERNCWIEITGKVVELVENPQRHGSRMQPGIILTGGEQKQVPIDIVDVLVGTSD